MQAKAQPMELEGNSQGHWHLTCLLPATKARRSKPSLHTTSNCLPLNQQMERMGRVSKRGMNDHCLYFRINHILKWDLWSLYLKFIYFYMRSAEWKYKMEVIYETSLALTIIIINNIINIIIQEVLGWAWFQNSMCNMEAIARKHGKLSPYWHQH